ncbi:MAG: GT4 family glycosyltransferase PelF, partial [Deltaproteobacteria bacterium]
MKIVQILPALKEGGVETGTIDLSLSLKARGHEVTVISNGGTGVKLLDQNGIRHLQWPVHKKNPWTIYRMSRKLARHIQKNSPDIIHARSRVPAWITYFAALKTKTRWVTTCHGYYQTHFWSRVMGWGDAVIVPSRTIEKHMREDFNVSEDKIVRIPRGVDLEKYPFEQRKANQKPIIAMIGRLTPIKGHKDFLKALSLLKKERGDFSAWLIGGNTEDNRYYEDLIKMRDSLGLKNDVDFLGHQEDIADLLKKIDLLVFPSTYPESFGRVVIEAQAAGVPVVASRLGGAQEIIEEGITGHLFQAGHPFELAAAIQRVFSNREETIRMTFRARLKVEKEFSKSQMVEKTEAIYLKLFRKKILIFKLSSLGDLILISPSVRAIRKHFPDGKITLITDFAAKEMVELCPYLDDILYIDKKAYWKNLPQIIKKLSSHAFDISIDF